MGDGMVVVGKFCGGGGVVWYLNLCVCVLYFLNSVFLSVPSVYHSFHFLLALGSSHPPLFLTPSPLFLLSFSLYFLSPPFLSSCLSLSSLIFSPSPFLPSFSLFPTILSVSFLPSFLPQPSNSLPQTHPSSLSPSPSLLLSLQLLPPSSNLPHLLSPQRSN